MQIKDLLEGFIRDCRCSDLAESTIDKHVAMFNKIIVPAIGNKELTELLPIHRNDIIDKANLGGKSTARHAILTFRKLLHYVKKCRIGSGVEAVEIDIPSYRRSRDVMAWSPEEIKQIRAVLSKDYSSEFSKHCRGRLIRGHQLAVKRTAALFELMIHSGLRLSEALSVNLENIDWYTCEVRVEDAKAEGEWKTVFLYGAEHAIKEYLSMRTDDCPALFVSMNGTRLCRNSAGTTLKRLKKRCVLDPKLLATFQHKTCRSTFITIPLKKGVDPKTVQQLAHHKSLYMTLNYYFQIIQSELKPLHQQIYSGI